MGACCKITTMTRKVQPSSHRFNTKTDILSPDVRFVIQITVTYQRKNRNVTLKNGFACSCLVQATKRLYPALALGWRGMSSNNASWHCLGVATRFLPAWSTTWNQV
jgi:hypothetical protein